MACEKEKEANAVALVMGEKPGFPVAMSNDPGQPTTWYTRWVAPNHQKAVRKLSCFYGFWAFVMLVLQIIIVCDRGFRSESLYGWANILFLCGLSKTFKRMSLVKSCSVAKARFAGKVLFLIGLLVTFAILDADHSWYWGYTVRGVKTAAFIIIGVSFAGAVLVLAYFSVPGLGGGYHLHQQGRPDMMVGVEDDKCCSGKTCLSAGTDDCDEQKKMMEVLKQFGVFLESVGKRFQKQDGCSVSKEAGKPESDGGAPPVYNI